MSRRHLSNLMVELDDMVFAMEFLVTRRSDNSQRIAWLESWQFGAHKVLCEAPVAPPRRSNVLTIAPAKYQSIRFRNSRNCESRTRTHVS
jgi:hypothetical protein